MCHSLYICVVVAFSSLLPNLSLCLSLCCCDILLANTCNYKYSIFITATGQERSDLWPIHHPLLLSSFPPTALFFTFPFNNLPFSFLSLSFSNGLFLYLSSTYNLPYSFLFLPFSKNLFLLFSPLSILFSSPTSFPLPFFYNLPFPFLLQSSLFPSFTSILPQHFPPPLFYYPHSPHPLFSSCNVLLLLPFF